MGSSASKGVAGSPNRKKSAIVYREKSLQQLPTTEANTFIENVFLISAGSAVGDGLPEQCILVSETARKSDIQLLTAHNVEQAVHERILSRSRGSVIVQSESSISQCKLPGEEDKQEKDEPFDETCVFKYLYHCFVRWKAYKRSGKCAAIADDIIKCKNVIFHNIKVCLGKPEMFTGQQIHKQFIDVCTGNKDDIFDQESHIHDFLMQLFAMLEPDQGCMMACFSPVLTYIRQRFKTQLKLIDAEEIRNLMLVLRVFTLKDSAAYMLMYFNAPSDWNKAICYEDTLIGSILSMNTCPKTDRGPYEFFNDPVDMSWEDVGKLFKIIWQRVAEVCEELYQVLIGCIRLSEDLRHVVLDWFGRCLEANRGKPDLWSAHEVEVFDTPYCSDSFCLNLCQVLLQMCQHFSEPNNQRLLQIRPAYCRAAPRSEHERKTMCVHARGLAKEIPFVPYREDFALPQCDVYHYTSDCFFLTHQALHIGYSVVFKFLKLNCNVLRLEKLYKEIKDTHPSDIVGRVKQQLNREACWCLNLKAAISQQHLTMRCLYFNIATASWLVQVASCDDVTEFKPVTLPLDSNVPKSLSYLPQYIITNLTQFIAPLKVFRSQDLLANNKGLLEHHITLMLVFIGRPDRLASSDVRAQLAEGLENILPRMNDDGTWATTKSGNTEKLFKEHPLIEHLAETILALFVGIEMKDQNVDDEKKFGYRSSMHRVIQYIWRIPRHKKAIKRLSDDAASAIGNPEPPLFLRFINLLINDAIFLLDEALDYMKQIRVYEVERDTGKWNKLSSEQFRDKESELQGLVVGGRSRNVMANHTLYTLELLTEEIRGIFCHHVMVDRLADMLNYFLEHLVGPKQCEYNVKDRKEYEFKPEQLVSDIAHIYVYLGQNEQFCKAVLGESRSFSANLFPQAMAVLKRISVSEEFICRFEGLSVKLKSMEGDHKHEEEVIAEAPEEFLDPVMGTLMVDPVKLPTSNTNMDRAVIARHLLSDQRDPFTNLPLSMDMVTTNSELKKKIEDWKMSHIKRPV